MLEKYSSPYSVLFDVLYEINIIISFYFIFKRKFDNLLSLAVRSFLNLR